MSTVPTNYRIKIKDLLNSSLGKVIIDKITANAVTINNLLTVDAANIKLDNEKGTTLQDILDYFEDNKLNRHTDDTFDGNLEIKKNLKVDNTLEVEGDAVVNGDTTIRSGNLTLGEASIVSTDGVVSVSRNFVAEGEISDGDGNILSDVNAASKGWILEYQDPTETEATVRAKYILKDYKGNAKGDVIKVYKDSAITNVYLGTTEDTCNPNTGEVTKQPITGQNDALCIVYHLDTGKYSMVNIPIGEFIKEAEVDSTKGLQVLQGKISIHLSQDTDSLNYLHFNGDGSLSVDGIQEHIDDADAAAEYANEEGDYAKEMGDYAKEQGDYANTQGTYAKEQGDIAADRIKKFKDVVYLGDIVDDEIISIDKTIPARLAELEERVRILESKN